MNRQEFEMQVGADGYTEVEAQNIAPRLGKGNHRHPFAVRGIVLSGAFIVKQDDVTLTYAPGDIFSVSKGKLHDEWVGADGAHVLVGRKFSDEEQT